MAYDPGAIDAALAAAVGDDPVLVAELRAAFVDSARRALIVVESAETEEAWCDALQRLRGLAASFGAVRLAEGAAAAMTAPAGDRPALRQLQRGVERL